MDGKEVIKILQQHGWKLLRITGSHHRMGKNGARTSVPVHSSHDLGKGLIATIERQTGVKLK